MAIERKNCRTCYIPQLLELPFRDHLIHDSQAGGDCDAKSNSQPKYGAADMFVDVDWIRCGCVGNMHYCALHDVRPTGGIVEDTSGDRGKGNLQRRLDFD